MRVLLVGGAGYIGAHVSRAFLDKSCRVGILDNLSSGREENIAPGVDFYYGDILDRDFLKGVLGKGWDGIVHLAAFKAAGESMLKPGRYGINNICGSIGLITGALEAGVRRFVLSSSAAVYGEPDYLPVDEDHPTVPTNYYGFTKLEIERNLHWFDELSGLRYAALRYFNAAGYDPEGRVNGLERNPANLIPVVMEVAAGRRPELSIFGSDYPTEDGTGVRDYIHVSDLADAHVRAFDYLMKNDESFTVNLGSETGLSVLQILEAARRISGREIPAAVRDRRAGDAAKLVASSTKAEKLLSWKTCFSGVDSIVETTWKAYQRNNA